MKIRPKFITGNIENCDQPILNFHHFLANRLATPGTNSLACRFQYVVGKNCAGVGGKTICTAGADGTAGVNGTDCNAGAAGDSTNGALLVNKLIPLLWVVRFFLPPFVANHYPLVVA